MVENTHDDRGAVVRAQDQFHGRGFDYDKGSPHLRHRAQRERIESDLGALVRSARKRTGRCRVIEIGAGHGTFTDALLAAGAEVTVTEVSRASAEELEAKYRNDPRVDVFFDESGEAALGTSSEFELAVCISVLHHIPDFLGFIDRLLDRVEVGGSFYSVQDPLYYPRMPPLVHRLHFAAYFVWRLGRGNYIQGIETRLRRIRGVYDDSKRGDTVEYHVVRDGVDEKAIVCLLQRRATEVELFAYWSTQAPLFQRLGDRSGLKTNFGVVARGVHG